MLRRATAAMRQNAHHTPLTGGEETIDEANWYTYTELCRSLRHTSIFASKKWFTFNPVIYIFCCSVSVGNISLHF